MKIKNAEHKTEIYKDKKNFAFITRRLVIITIVVAIAAAAFFIYQFLTAGKNSSITDNKAGTYTVTKSDLVISVTESGDVMALNSNDIQSEVEGGTTIINIVDEGTIITEQDVKETFDVEDEDQTKGRDDHDNEPPKRDIDPELGF